MKQKQALQILIIADNGGGMTLQLQSGRQQRYQHYYLDARDLVRDLKDAQADPSFSGWEGNDLEDEALIAEEARWGTPIWLAPTYDDIRNGGYLVFSPQELRDLDPDTCGWHNAQELHALLSDWA